MDDDFDLVAISMGGGVQSSMMHLAACDGMFGRLPDASIFGDTGNEMAWTMEMLDYLEENGSAIPLYRESVGNLGEDWFTGQESTVRDERAMGAAMPLHLDTGGTKKGFASRTCTQRYKVTPVYRVVKRLLGLEPGEQAKDRVKVEMWIGYSIDEADRCKSHDPQRPWVTIRYPLIEMGFSRSDCRQWMLDNGHPEPRRSACHQCPMRGDSGWREIKKLDPVGWAQAVDYDKRLRTQAKFVSVAADSDKALLRGVPYLHSSLRPLDEVDLNENQLDLFANECGGFCDT